MPQMTRMENVEARIERLERSKSVVNLEARVEKLEARVDKLDKLYTSYGLYAAKEDIQREKAGLTGGITLYPRELGKVHGFIEFKGDVYVCTDTGLYQLEYRQDIKKPVLVPIRPE